MCLAINAQYNLKISESEDVLPQNIVRFQVSFFIG